LPIIVNDQLIGAIGVGGDTPATAFTGSGHGGRLRA
jgi:uncharacterized protein GlcG (DUF336 family)